jgi:hypothetical protein
MILIQGGQFLLGPMKMRKNRSERWMLRKANRRYIDAFELWTRKRLIRLPWTARRTNASVIKEI